ncbi:MAG: rhomboid family intramembrane serine protease [Bdellovibrionales bacterium]|nr:rhomboid family intramembrane serine protease [Bdellovibrionales bacterium]
MQMQIQMTAMVKKLIIINVAIWLLFVMILQKVFFSQAYIYEYFGLIPKSFLFDFFLWQPFTYMFLHSSNFFHILFNMLILWMFGSELEARWGSRFFLIYYLVSGVGAAFIYVVCTLLYYLFTNNDVPLSVPVIGASGATFGLILAYGLIFSERTVLFMFVFPMKAKYFALLLAIIELMTLLDSGFGSQVANLAHLGGVVSGFLFLYFYSRWKTGRLKKKPSRHGRKLKLVVDNESHKDKKRGPRYWN